MTLIDAVRRHAERLESAGVAFGQGTTNAFDEAAWLALWSIGLAPDTLGEHADRELDDDESARIAALVERRIATRLPAAYLTGEAWLQGVPFDVDARVIVPRSFVAEAIADGTIDAWLVGGPPRRVLDLCTGGGSLAVLAALAWRDARIDACDVSTDALLVARRNVERHGLAGRIALLRCDLLDAIDASYDLIVCNPPYVNARSMSSLPPEFRAEPALALSGGGDGMDLVRRIVRDAPSRLAHDDAPLVLEIGHERAHFERAFPALEPVWLPVSAGDDCLLLATRGALLRCA